MLSKENTHSDEECRETMERVINNFRRKHYSKKAQEEKRLSIYNREPVKYEKKIEQLNERLLDTNFKDELPNAHLTNEDINILEDYASKLFNTINQDKIRAKYNGMNLHDELYNVMEVLVANLNAYRYNYSQYHLHLTSYSVDDMINPKNKTKKSTKQFEDKSKKLDKRVKSKQIDSVRYELLLHELIAKENLLDIKQMLPMIRVTKEPIKNLLINKRNGEKQIPYLIGKTKQINEFLEAIKNNPTRNDILNFLK